MWSSVEPPFLERLRRSFLRLTSSYAHLTECLFFLYLCLQQQNHRTTMAILVKTDLWAASRRDDPWMALEWLEQQLSTALQLLVVGTLLELQPQLASSPSSSSGVATATAAAADVGMATRTTEPLNLRLRTLDELARAFESALLAMRGNSSSSSSSSALSESSHSGGKNVEESKTTTSGSSGRAVGHHRSYGSERMATVVRVLRRLMPLVDWPSEVVYTWHSFCLY